MPKSHTKDPVTARVTILMTDAEKDRLFDRAEQAGQSVGAYVRDVVFGRPDHGGNPNAPAIADRLDHLERRLTQLERNQHTSS